MNDQAPAAADPFSAGKSVPLPRRIGIVAGEGDFPVLIAQGARAAGVDVVVFSVRGLASEKIVPLAERHFELKLTELSKLIKLARECQVEHLVLAGRVPHQLLLKQISFDPRVLKLLAKLSTKTANSLLEAVIAELEGEGFTVLDSTLFLRQCMPEPGLLTLKCPPTSEIERDIEFAYPLAREIARLDIGQTIAVKNQIVVAVEALEGTDKLILRAGELAGEGVVFVKVSRPRQDMRFDVPVAGRMTVENLIKVKAAAFCLEARRSLLFDRGEVVALAERSGICLLAR